MTDPHLFASRPAFRHNARLIALMAVLGLGVAGLASCGVRGELTPAPPIVIFDGKSSSSVKRETERAKPEETDKNKMKHPYSVHEPIRNAPIEGAGNAQGRTGY